MKHCLVTGLLFALALAAQPKPGNGTIDGHVFNSLTGEPLRKAMVTLTGRDGVGLTDDSNVEGKFHFAGLPAGTYRISAMHGGFVAHSARYAITLGPNDNVAGAEVRLAPQGVISGRVLDEDGDPSPGANVSILKQVYRDGRKQWDQGGGGISNDAGEYRFPVMPGRYLIRATSQRRGVDNTYGVPAKMFYITVYYPNAATQQAALPVEVGSGADVRGIDVHLFKRAATPSYHVKGKVTGVPAGSPVVFVGLRGNDDFECGGNDLVNPPDYTFDFTSHGGQCTVLANVFSGSPEAYGTGSLAISGDVAGLVINMIPSPTVTGRVRLAETEAKAKLEGIRFTLLDHSPVGGLPSQQATRADAEGAFAFGKWVRPARYLLHFDPETLPEGCFVREARIEGQEISLDDVDIQNSTPIDVILSNTAAKIKGSVVDGDGKPFPISTVTLIPTDGKSQAVKQAADDNGNFEIAHLRPGKYLLFAWEEIDNDLWPDPDFRKKYENRATEVTVGPSESQSAQVRVILAEEMK